MKQIIKLTLILLIGVLVASVCSCQMIESVLFGGDDYAFSDVKVVQTDVTEFRIEFSANVGFDDVDVYFTEGFRLSESTKPRDVKVEKDGMKTRFAFTDTLNLGEDYYLWLVCGEKQAKMSVTVPSMFPSVTKNDDGSATLNFKYTYGTSWGSFCDPKGKAVYKSAKPEFDSSATLVCDEIDITQESATIPADVFDESCYYYAVSTAKDGTMTTVSRPVMIYDSLISQVQGIEASLTNDLHFKLDIKIPESAAMAGEVKDSLGLVIKTDIADDILVSDCTYEGGVATMSIDCSKLIFDGLWYDVLISWRGAIVMDVPKSFGGVQVDKVSTVARDGISYHITSWKPEGADDSQAAMKVFFEENTTKYADDLFKSYLVSFNSDAAPTLTVVATLKDGIGTVPSLAITGGDTNKLAEAWGVANDDGSYAYTLAVEDALTEADKWYDLRFFVGLTPYEMQKDSCIDYTGFSAKYDSANRTYEFREYNGLLKLMYTNK